MPVTLYNTPIPYTNKVKILGVTYDNGLTFKEHIADIKLRCIPKLLSSESYYKPRIWTEQGYNNDHTQTVHQIHSRILQHQLDTKPLRHTLQIQQNNALRTATGCTKTTLTDHIHRETKTLFWRALLSHVIGNVLAH